MEQDLLARNLDRMRRLLESTGNAGAHRYVGLELERFLIASDGTTVPYEGDKGVGALIAALAEKRRENELVHIDGRLMGLAYRIPTALGDVPATVSLEPAAQIELSVGPCKTAEALYLAILAFDADVAAACADIGLDAALVARGYNPTVAQPLDLPLIPKERYRHMDAYLSGQGRYARDMMRGTASTQVSLDYTGERDACRLLRVAEVLGAVFAFLFDNAPVFRGKPAPGMTRSRIWREMDPDRCGTLPGSLSPGYSFARYAEWVSGVKPILFTDRDHVTYPTGDKTARDLMGERELADDELLHLMSMVFPNVRLKGFLEYREMDALPPRLAAACASFAAATLYHMGDGANEDTADEQGTQAPDGCDEFSRGDDDTPASALDALPFDLDTLREADIDAARLELEERGWDARPYGMPVQELALALLDIADRHARGDFDRESFAMLRELWGNRRLPRDER